MGKGMEALLWPVLALVVPLRRVAGRRDKITEHQREPGAQVAWFRTLEAAARAVKKSTRAQVEEGADEQPSGR